MWLPQGGALKIENLQLTQYSMIYSYQLTIMINLTVSSRTLKASLEPPDTITFKGARTIL